MSLPQERERCQYCKFFKSNRTEPDKGECQRFPPPNKEGQFPEVRDTDWCGEFESNKYHD